MEERRKSGIKDGNIKDGGSLYRCDCCFNKLYTIFAGLVIKDVFKEGVLVGSKDI